GDPFALRRAALGTIRIIREDGLRLSLRKCLVEAANEVASTQVFLSIEKRAVARHAYESQTGDHLPPTVQTQVTDLNEIFEPVLDLLVERLRVQLRSEGARPDIVAAVFGATPDDDLNRLLRRAEAVRVFLATEDGANLLTAHRRAANILRIEERKDGH